MQINLPDKVELDFQTLYNSEKVGDCRTQLFVRILNYYGIQIKPSTIFGLGSGLAFNNHTINFHGFDVTTVSGRCLDAEKRCCQRMNLEFNEYVSDYTPEKLNAQIPFDPIILEYVSKGNPVVINCDIAALPFAPIEKHNSFHLVAVVGYDITNRMLTLYDSLTYKIEKITMEELCNAMFVESYSPIEKGTCYIIGKKNKPLITDKIIVESLIYQGKAMIDEKGSLSQIKEFISYIEWCFEHAQSGKKSYINYLSFVLDANALLIRQEDEIDKTFFRSVYHRYLCDAKEKKVCSEKNIEHSIKCITKSEKLWKEISFKVRYMRNDLDKQYKLFHSILNDILNIETDLANTLVNIQ